MEVSTLERLLLTEFDQKTSNLGRNLCPLYRECPLYGVSILERFLCSPKIFFWFFCETPDYFSESYQNLMVRAHRAHDEYHDNSLDTHSVYNLPLNARNRDFEFDSKDQKACILFVHLILSNQLWRGQLALLYLFVVNFLCIQCCVGLFTLLRGRILRPLVWYPIHC